ncbi:MAG: NAD/NADP octopine/nopaline dehydrogenase family protein [Alistipes sp.]|nr:NAD/NADP octopine/nopaline dehydrogenase family protein [Alistipes sp.]
MHICICGGGSLAHACAAVLSQQEDVNINIYTQRPHLWNKTICAKDTNGVNYVAKINVATSNIEIATAGCDIILICLPGFLIEDTLRDLRPHLNKDTIIGSIVSSTGFFFMAHKVLSNTTPLFGFQRVPFIARVDKYGQSANILGYKSELFMAVENIANQEEFRATIARLFATPTSVLSNYYEASLTNSNPILHTGRLYNMWHQWDGTPYDNIIFFYKEWTIEDSKIIIDMDNEFMSLLDSLPVNKKHIPSLLDYYESRNAEELTKKISSISAFKTITAPMKLNESGSKYIPDFNSRYFTEDFPFGLKYIKLLADSLKINTPTINRVYSWGNNIITNETN